MASSSKSRHPGATINSSKGKTLSYQTNAMRVPPATSTPQIRQGASFASPTPSSGGVTRSVGSAPAKKSTGTKGIKHFSYSGGLKSPGQFTG